MDTTETETTETIRVRVLWGSKSSGGKWGYRAIDALKGAGARFDGRSKTWELPADASLIPSVWTHLEEVA